MGRCNRSNTNQRAFKTSPVRRQLTEVKRDGGRKCVFVCVFVHRDSMQTHDFMINFRERVESGLYEVSGQRKNNCIF